MKLTRDDQTDSVRLELKEGEVVRTKEVGQDVVLELGDDGVPVGLRVLHLTHHLPTAEVDGRILTGGLMDVDVDEEADALYLTLQKGSLEHTEVSDVDDNVILDFDAQDKLHGVEALNLSRRHSWGEDVR